MSNFKHYWGVNRLKQLLRQGWVDNVPLSAIESIADHSFGVAYFSYIFSLWENELRSNKDLNPLKHDPNLLCVAGLLHDLAEGQYGDFDKNLLEVLPEIKTLKPLAEERGYTKITEFWSNKSNSIKESLNKLFIDNLDPESKLFIEIVDKIELHWQTISYYKKNWISLSNALPFITSTFQFLKNNKNQFIFVKELINEKLIIDDLKNMS